MYYKIEDYGDYLMHHGRQGQKWGVRNGPPYPLQGSYAQTVEGYKEYQEKRKQKRRQKILNDPKKLYKHKDEFTKEEIEDALQKHKTVEELKNVVDKKKPANPSTPQKKDPYISPKRFKLVDTPEKYKKNYTKLTPEEQEAARKQLNDISTVDNMHTNKHTNKTKRIQNLANRVQSIANIIKNLIDTGKRIDSVKKDLGLKESERETAKAKIKSAFKGNPELADKISGFIDGDYLRTEIRQDAPLPTVINSGNFYQFKEMYPELFSTVTSKGWID